MKSTHKAELSTLPSQLLKQGIFSRLTAEELARLNTVSQKLHRKTAYPLKGRWFAYLIDHAIDEVTDTISSDYLTILQYLPSSHQSWIPYLLANLVFKHYHTTFASIVLKNRIKNETLEDTTTSCINTALICYAIFTGAITSNSILQFVDDDTKVRLHLTDKWDSPIYLNTASLFDLVITPFCHDPALESAIQWWKIPELHDAFEVKLHTYLQMRLIAGEEHPSVVNKTLMKYFSDFNHNLATMNHLKKSVETHKAATTPEKSHFYFMLASNNTTISHAWIIEQFYSHERQAVRYRRYQSWIRETTLLKELAKGHNIHPDRSWNEIKLERFLNKVERLYCTHHEERISSKRCFGYGGKKTRPHTRTTYLKKDTLHTQTLGFFCRAVNPTTCIDHFEGLAWQSEPLRKYFNLD